MRVIKLDNENDSAHEKPENAWSEEDKNKFECLTAYIPSLKAIRKCLTNSKSSYHNILFHFSEMFFLPFMVALGVVSYSLTAVNFYFDSNFTTDV